MPVFVFCIHTSVWLPVAFNVVSFQLQCFLNAMELFTVKACVICYTKCVSNLLCLMNQLVVLCYCFLLSFLQDHIPFGVVGSKEEIIAGGKRIRARQYPWGLVEGQFYIPNHKDMNMST